MDTSCFGKERGCADGRQAQCGQPEWHDEPRGKRLLGSPAFIETPGVLRRGRKGRMRVDTRRGRWHDFESRESSGVVDLVSRCMNLSRSEAVKWLCDDGFFTAQAVSATE